MGSKKARGIANRRDRFIVPAVYQLYYRLPLARVRAMLSFMAFQNGFTNQIVVLHQQASDSSRLSRGVPGA